MYLELPQGASGTLFLNMWWNSANTSIKNVKLVTSSTNTTTTTPVVTTTAPVTTTKTTTTTKINSTSNSKYIPVNMKDSTINVSDYTSKNVVGVTFKLTGKSSGSGACHLTSKNNDWLGSLDYKYSNTDTVTIDLSKYSNIGVINLYMWWNSNGQSITDVQLITK